MLGTHKTTIKHEGGATAVRYHWTDVVTFDNNTISTHSIVLSKFSCFGVEQPYHLTSWY